MSADVNEAPCSGGLRPSPANADVPPLSSIGSDAHPAPLQAIEPLILTSLVALNHERAAKQQRGLIR